MRGIISAGILPRPGAARVCAAENGRPSPCPHVGRGALAADRDGRVGQGAAGGVFRRERPRAPAEALAALPHVRPVRRGPPDQVGAGVRDRPARQHEDVRRHAPAARGALLGWQAGRQPEGAVHAPGVACGAPDVDLHQGHSASAAGGHAEHDHAAAGRAAHRRAHQPAAVGVALLGLALRHLCQPAGLGQGGAHRQPSARSGRGQGAARGRVGASDSEHPLHVGEDGGPGAPAGRGRRGLRAGAGAPRAPLPDRATSLSPLSPTDQCSARSSPCRCDSRAPHATPHGRCTRRGCRRSAPSRRPARR